MNQEAPISKQLFIATLIGSLAICGFIYLTNILNQKTQIVFCDVGNGSAVYIRVNNKVDVLINTGPDRKVLNCLSKYMPFYDRTIEYIFITEDTSSDISGLNFVLDRYKVVRVISKEFSRSTKATDEINNNLLQKKIQSEDLTDGDIYTILDLTVFTYCFSSNKVPRTCTLYMTQGLYKIELLGNATRKDIQLLERIHRDSVTMNNFYLLQAPHYGSKDRLNAHFLMLALPKTVVISAKQSTTTDLSSMQLIDLLKAIKINYLRTGEVGSIKFTLN